MISPSSRTIAGTSCPNSLMLLRVFFKASGFDCSMKPPTMSLKALRSDVSVFSIQAHPRGDSVVLSVVVQLVELDPVHAVVIGNAIDGQLADAPRILNIPCGDAFLR